MMLRCAPAVFAVEDTYQIMVPVTKPSLFSVEVNGVIYDDESNGIMRSLSDLHRVTVPGEELDRAKKYTVLDRELMERKPYFTKTYPLKKYEFSFCPVKEGNIRAYHISDAHGDVQGPISAGRAFGDADFLIFNGDILEHSGNPEDFYNIYEISAALTEGKKPVVFSRGNHDLRGNYAEKFADYTPSHLGHTYYTFRLGSIWGIVLDCGEDKTDDHEEYGFTVCCEKFRQRQTKFIKSVIEKKEYEDPNIKTRVVISHVPFSCAKEEPFDIEKDTYREWSRLLKEYIRPQVMICGHTHEMAIRRVGCKEDVYGQPCDVVEGGSPENGKYAGCGYLFEENEIKVQFTDSEGTKSPFYIIQK